MISASAFIDVENIGLGLVLRFQSRRFTFYFYQLDCNKHLDGHKSSGAFDADAAVRRLDFHMRHVLREESSCVAMQRYQKSSKSTSLETLDYVGLSTRNKHQSNAKIHSGSRCRYALLISHIVLGADVDMLQLLPYVHPDTTVTVFERLEVSIVKSGAPSSRDREAHSTRAPYQRPIHVLHSGTLFVTIRYSGYHSSKTSLRNRIVKPLGPAAVVNHRKQGHQ